MTSDLPTAFFITAAVLVFFTSASKAGLGDGFGALSVPILSAWVAPALAAGIMLPILCMIDIFAVWRYWRHIRFRIVLTAIPGALLGIGLGTLTFGMVPPAAVKLLVAGVAFWFCALYLLGGTRADARPAGRVKAAIFGTAAGYTSHIAHAGGPPMRGFLLSQNLDKTAFLGCMSAFFFVVNYVKLLPYALLGQITADTLWVGLMLLPAVPLGALAGFWLHDRVPQALFTRIAYGLLALAAVNLSIAGLGELF